MSVHSHPQIRAKNRAHQLGSSGEDLAAKYLLTEGFLIIDQNWRGTFGEIDIIVQKSAIEREFIFVEVKTRSSLRFGEPLEAITPEKYRRLYRLGSEWIAQNHPRAQWRIDVIALLGSTDGLLLTHHRGLTA